MSKPAKSVMGKVNYDGQKMSIVEVLNCLNALNDEVMLTTTEAAIFLRVSVTTMERWRRQDGVGPEYIQPGVAGAKGTNQSCYYLKSALIAWQKKNTVTGSLAAAIRKVQTFSTIFDIAESLPYYLNPNGDVESRVENNTLGTVVERVGKTWEVVWMPATEACARRWSSLAAHKEIAEQVQKTLSDIQTGITNSVEATDIAESLKG
jgi:hypothetical protein